MYKTGPQTKWYPHQQYGKSNDDEHRAEAKTSVV
jgi:hypothetical protein